MAGKFKALDGSSNKMTTRYHYQIKGQRYGSHRSTFRSKEDSLTLSSLDGRIKKQDSSLRDVKYREKLKNCVNILELVLPLSKEVRCCWRLYEDALELTAILQESLFHLVNCLRIQNQENIYNFAVFTPSYVQASFVNLTTEMGKKIKNGIQMNTQQVEEVSSLASKFFTGLVRKCSNHRPMDRIANHEVAATVSSKSNTTTNTSKRQPLLTVPQCPLVCGRTRIADYMEFSDNNDHGSSTPTATKSLALC